MDINLSNTIFPPIVETYNPAFTASGGRVYFTISQYNSFGNIVRIEYIIRDRDSNKSIMPGNSDTANAFLLDEQNNSYYFLVGASIASAMDLNKYYKLQIRLLVDNEYSEWSTVLLIRRISEPTIKLQIDGENTDDKTIPVDSQILAEVVLEFADKEETDSLAYYSFSLNTLSKKVIEESGRQFNSVYSSNIATYQFNTISKEKESFLLIFQYETQAGYTGVIQQKYTVAGAPAEIVDDDSIVYLIEPDKEKGNMHIFIDFSEYSGGVSYEGGVETLDDFQIVLRRASYKDNFNTWTDLETIHTRIGTSLNYYDVTAESGVWYKYTFVIKNSKPNSWKFTKHWEEMKERPFVLITENSFLINENGTLRLQLNDIVSSFKYNVKENVTDTLGSKYPFFRRNGYTNYRQFEISGMIASVGNDIMESDIKQLNYIDEKIFEISYKETDDSILIPNKPYFLKTGERYELYTGNEIIEGLFEIADYTTWTFPKEENIFLNKEEVFEEDMADYYQEYFNTYANGSKYSDIIFEKIFRDKVMDYLQADTAKLYKSTTEGNILIRLTNISFTPEKTLGRMIYSFSATAIEIDECNMDNYRKYAILPKKKIEPGYVYVIVAGERMKGDKQINYLNFVDGDYVMDITPMNAQEGLFPRVGPKGADILTPTPYLMLRKVWQNADGTFEIIENQSKNEEEDKQ